MHAVIIIGQGVIFTGDLIDAYRIRDKCIADGLNVYISEVF